MKPIFEYKFCVRAWFFSAIFILFFFASHTAGAQPYVWKLGHLLPPTHPYHLGAVEFVSGVEKDTNGKVKIEIHHSGSIGSEKDMTEQIRFGALEMGLISTAPMSVIEPKLEAEQLPYAWPTREHAYAALDGELGKKFKELLAAKGIYILAYAENGYRHITNNIRPIYKPEDAKGMKIRSAEVPMRLETFKLLGILPTPMAFTELFMALQQGTVDGQENPAAIIYSSRLYEVQKYMSLTGHIWGSANFNINKKLWDKLPNDIQEALQRNASRAAIYERKLIQQTDSELIDKLRNSGMKVNEVDSGPFKIAVRPIYDKYKPVYGQEIMDLIAKDSR
jgi:tripartite ATP-independent transporter DctP family solute receptor